MTWFFDPLLPDAAGAGAGGASVGSASHSLTPSQTETGTLAISGSASQSLTPSQLATGALAISGSASQSLTPSQTATGTGGGISGSVSHSLTPSQVAAGALAVSGSASHSLTPSQAATGALAISGFASQSLTPSQSATGMTGSASAGSASHSLAPLSTIVGALAIPRAPTTPLAVQRGILQACRIALAASDGWAAATPVFDHVPHGQAFPFVALDHQQVLQNDGCEIHGFTHNFFLSVWSSYRGQKEVWEILDRVWRGLHDRTLRLENGVHVLCQVTEQGSDRDADGVTYMGRLTARIRTNPLGND